MLKLLAVRVSARVRPIAVSCLPLQLLAFPLFLPLLPPHLSLLSRASHFHIMLWERTEPEQGLTVRGYMQKK